MKRNIILFDTEASLRSLLPLTFTRPAAQIRCGALRINEKWELLASATVSYLTSPMLSELFPMRDDGDNLFVAGALLPTRAIAETALALEPGESLVSEDNRLVAYRGTVEAFKKGIEGGKVVDGVKFLDGPQDIFTLNGAELVSDFALLTAGRTSQPVPQGCTVIGDSSQLFIEEGAKLTACVINVAEGPVYIGRDAEVMELSVIRGPFALCEHGVIKMGAKIYGETTVGPYCKVGGEVGNAVFLGYANKAHDGYLGNAVIGEWCNLGAGCVSSNLKNDYSLIRLWDYATCTFRRTKMQFCGLIMGDHSKAGIQTMFNTATVVGVGCNIHGAGFPRTFIPSFSYGGAHGFTRVIFNKFVETARTVMARRHIELTAPYLNLLTRLYELDDCGKAPETK